MYTATYIHICTTTAVHDGRIMNDLAVFRFLEDARMNRRNEKPLRSPLPLLHVLQLYDMYNNDRRAHRRKKCSPWPQTRAIMDGLCGC